MSATNEIGIMTLDHGKRARVTVGRDPDNRRIGLTATKPDGTVIDLRLGVCDCANLIELLREAMMANGRGQ